jgi:tetratricopeptide (TPR) repeat protein
MVLRIGGHIAESRDVLLESIALFEELGNMGHLANSYMQLGLAMLQLGKYEQSYEQFDKAVVVYRQMGPWAPPDNQLFKGFAAIGIGAYEEAYQLAQESAAVSGKFHLSLGLATRGIAAHRLGNTIEAQYCVLKSLQIGSEIRSVLHIGLVLAAIALLLAEEGKAERAVELYSLLTKQWPMLASSRWYYDIAGRFVESAATSLPPEVAAAAQARGRSLDLWQAVDDLLRVLHELGWSEGNGDSTGEPPLAT